MFPGVVPRSEETSDFARHSGPSSTGRALCLGNVLEESWVNHRLQRSSVQFHEKGLKGYSPGKIKTRLGIVTDPSDVEGSSGFIVTV